MPVPFFGKLLQRVDDEHGSLVIEKRGTPRAVLLSIRDYMKPSVLFRHQILAQDAAEDPLLVLRVRIVAVREPRQRHAVVARAATRGGMALGNICFSRAARPVRALLLESAPRSAGVRSYRILPVFAAISQ
jgi:prevent-host-death family protein